MTAVTTGSHYKYVLKALGFCKKARGLCFALNVWYEAPASTVKDYEGFKYEYNRNHFHLKI